LWAYLAAADDEFARVAPAHDRYGDFAAFLGSPDDNADARRALRQSETSGRPLGRVDWIASLEERTGRMLGPQKRGPKPKDKVVR